MSDACGCSDDETTPGGEEAEEHEAERLWEVSELRFAAVAGVLLLAGLVAGSRDQSAVATVLNWVALLVGAWTFAPSTTS